MKTLLSLAVVGTLLFAGIAMSANDCKKITLDSSFTAKTKTDKQTALKDKIWQDVKLNQIPELDLSVTTIADFTQAYIDLANGKNARTDNNLFKGLRDEAVKEGVKCI